METRNMLMDELGWNRRIATLAARLAMGVDTWESIELTPNFNDNPLLYEHEIRMIRTIGLETIREEMIQ
jgi:hypothetical protein